MTGRSSFVWPIVNEQPRPYRGLGLWRDRWLVRLGAQQSAPAPFGWRWLKVMDRDAMILLPLWLYWPVLIEREWRHYVYGPLIRLGFWKLNEGDFYWNGQWTWRFWSTLTWYRGERRIPASRWERFGWAIEKLAWCITHDADRAPDFAHEQWSEQRYAADVRRHDIETARRRRELEWAVRTILRQGATV